MKKFDFTVTFNQNGELLFLEPKDKERVPFEVFRGEYEPLDGILMQEIPIDLTLLRVEGEDPCIKHNGRRY